MSYGENKLTKKREIFKNILSLEFISFTSETIFELLVLKSFDSHLIYNHASFKGFANSYNHFFDSFSIYINENSNKRCVLNRRRLSESWFYYKFIQYYNEFNGGLENFPMPFVKDLDVELNKIKQSVQSHFIKKWSSDYHLKKCINLNCSTAVVMDGNHKINRIKCLYDEEFIRIPELESKRASIKRKI